VTQSLLAVMGCLTSPSIQVGYEAQSIGGLRISSSRKTSLLALGLLQRTKDDGEKEGAR